MTIINAQNLVHYDTEELMRLFADVGDELQRRYRVSKAEQTVRADALKRAAKQVLADANMIEKAQNKYVDPSS